MSEKTREVKKIQDTMYTTEANEQVVERSSMSIGCVGKLGHLSGFLRHYLLILLVQTLTGWTKNGG